MEESKRNKLLMDKITKLDDIEMCKVKVLSVIFQKTSKSIMDSKIQCMQSNLEKQAEYYNRSLDDYDDICESLLAKYQEQLYKIIEKYNQLYINLQIELQEAECNEKIAITNLKKSYDIKEKLLSSSADDLLEEYNKKIKACIQKKNNYEIIIQACEKELDECSIRMEDTINSIFENKETQISLKQTGFLANFFAKIRNFFIGGSKFNTYVVEPISIELEMIEDKLPDIINEIQEETITFVAKIRQAKDETNKIFQKMI